MSIYYNIYISVTKLVKKPNMTTKGVAGLANTSRSVMAKKFKINDGSSKYVE